MLNPVNTGDETMDAQLTVEVTAVLCKLKLTELRALLIFRFVWRVQY